MASKYALSVELADRNYGKVHTTGCRDLRDAESVSNAADPHQEIWPEGPAASASDYAPCAVTLLKEHVEFCPGSWDREEVTEVAAAESCDICKHPYSEHQRSQVA